VNEILALGIILFFGWLGGWLISRIKIPAVTGYILMGLALGVSALHIISPEWNAKLSWLINFALILIAFTVGGKLDVRRLAKMGRYIGNIVIFETLFAYSFIFVFVKISGFSLPLSLIIASLGAATAPAVTVLVLNEYKAKGPVSTVLLACVGIDDALGLTLYAISASFAHVLLHGGHISIGIIILQVFLDISISLILGIMGGFLLSFIVKVVRYKVELLTIVLGTILLITGLIQNPIRGIHFSPLLSSMAMGFIVINYSRRKMDIFEVLENFGLPFYTIYFVLAGAKLQIKKLIELGVTAIAYLVGRILGKFTGAYIGAIIGKAPKNVRNYTGLGPISQAGIAIGLALIAANEFPELSSNIIAIALGTTIVTEILGPFMTKFAISRAGEIGKRK